MSGATALSADVSPWPEGRAPCFARHVVLVTIDTLRADAPGFSGNPLAETPHLDELARSGWIFERAHGHSVMTLPSHANLLTGQLPYQHGIRDNAGFVLPESVPTAAGAFARAGFRTAAFVAAFPLDSRYGLDRGFEVYDDSYPEGSTRGFAVAERSGEEVVEAAIQWWRQHEGERRFLWVHIYEPHVPYVPPEPFASRFAEHPYLGEVAAADEYAGKLISAVKAPPAGSNVLIVVTSDHGEALGEHGEKTHGLFAYEATLAVPLVIWAEGLAAARIEWPVRHVDVLPTMLEAAGVAALPAGGTAGRSLWRAPNDAAGAVLSAPDTTYFESLGPNLQRGWAPLRGVIASLRRESGEFGPRLLKYVSLPLPELYDLGEDPAETRNLHAVRSDAALELASLLPVESEWPPQAGAVSEEERRALQSLGYLSSSGGGELKRTYGEGDDPKLLADLDRMIQDYSEAYQDGLLELAEELARRTIERRPEMGLGYSNLAQVLLEQGRTDEALSVMIDAERRGLASPYLHRQLALTLVRIGRPRDAVRLMEQYLDSRDPDALNVLGLVLAESGDHRRAKEVLLRSIEFDGRNPEARQNLALSSLHEGDWLQAEREARAAVALSAELPLAWNYLGIALFNQGREAEAIKAWQRSVELDPNDLDVLYNLATVLARFRSPAVARPALERFVREASLPGIRERYSAELGVARTLLRGP